MALSLNAEQKNLLKLFKIEEQYIIPTYQRPYSWEYDQCFQLYTDILNSFKSNEDYFIGNIIIAKSEKTQNSLEIVDGQQRLITLLLLIKVLSLFQPELKILSQLLEKEDWEGSNNIPRIKSNIFEADDNESLQNVLAYTLENLIDTFKKNSDKHKRIIEKKNRNKFEKNILYFYSWISFYKSNNDNLKDFISYLLTQVYLLPIELTGKTQDEANEKALTIFETINNRGLNLEDADIFKAKLYDRAKKINEQEIFIDLWTDFKSGCDNLNLKIDDIFRYYSHIIRGKEAITSGEINLREFFIRENYSPFELKKYKEVLTDLFKIVEILEFLNKEKIIENESATWLQIIDAYTNQYPKYAIVNYLFVNDIKINPSFIDFIKSLVRYIYYQGSTTSVKFEIYNIIKQISFKQEINNYYQDVPFNLFDYLGRLKKGFSLLAFYLLYPKAISSYNVDRIVTLKDKPLLKGDWENANLSEIIENLGNSIILDIPKKSIDINRKKEYYSTSNIHEVKTLFSNGDYTFLEFLERDIKIKETLINFFEGNHE
ncbi:DUF262 domain-containing protein [Chryseobacterium sp. ERMR1:04]|uniref:DUF262 domain-containing protein n=1 Tax=Chryseobacterium sp. ERMR1:04 TaxID=1705393 RepID=UPI0006C842E6|nr:DUF262 domain-containing protein [Chryseobacterium sp. ERMR1:04]KPH15129.1 hypothetical protein AMQ68_06965 [Chryseobacterium sp. ERMR1:04]